MTKTDWLNIKKRGQYTLDLLWDYWKNNRKETYNNPTEAEFKKAIQVYIQNGGRFNQAEINLYYDIKFHITKLLDTRNQLIKEL